MRRIVRRLLWVIKRVSLAVALVALILWPLSHQYGGLISLSRYTPQANSVKFVGYRIGWCEGYIAIFKVHTEHPRGALSFSPDPEITHGAGWRLHVESRSPVFLSISRDHAWGPFRWDANDRQDPPDSYADRSIAAPCWLIALVAGTWPLIRPTLLLRRRMRQDRLARAGCCIECGYDLRASPKAREKLLDKCPECGAVRRRTTYR